jgi:hypothetical protein
MLKTQMFPACLILVCSLTLLIVVPELDAGIPATASVQTIRYWGTSDDIRVIIDLDSEAHYEGARITGPDRIFLDLSNTKLNKNLQDKILRVENALLKRIRVAQNQSNVVRVVLDLSATAGYLVSELHNPFRIVIDLRGGTGSKVGLSPLLNASKPLPDEIIPGPKSYPPAVDAAGEKPAPGPKLASENNDKPKPQTYLLTETDAVSQPPKVISTALIENIRYLVSNARTRVVIDLDSNARYESARLTNPDRIYLDISTSRLSSRFQNHAVTAGDKLLKLVRVAQNRSDVVRVVLYVSENTEYRAAELSSPSCIVVDLQDMSSKLTAAAEPAPGSEIAQKTRLSSNPVPANEGFTYVAQPDPQQSLALLEGIASSIEEGEPPLKSPRPDVPPLSITGIMSTGYYSSFNRGGGNENQKINFTPAGATIDAHGYFRSPDLVDYSVQTELNAGSQASDAGFIGGNGFRASVTALRRGAFPLTFRYSNMQLKDAYFGSLTQISSYTIENRNKDLGLTAGMKLPGLPSVTVDLGNSSVRSQSFNPVIPDYNSQLNHLNLSCTDKRWGWDFQCFAGRQGQTSGLFTPQSEELSTSLLQQKITQYRASARRSFLADSELNFEGGSQHTENIVLNRPIDLTTRYVSANLRMNQRSRWKTSLRAGYTSNIAGLLLSQLVGGLGNNGSLAPDESVLKPFQRTTSFFNLNGITSVDLSRGFGFYGSIDRTAVFTTRDNELDSKYFTTGGGLTYSRTYRWGSLSGEYGRSLGIGSVTGQAGRILGQNYIFTAQPGKPDGLLFDITVRGSHQKIRYDIPAQERGFAGEMGVGFPVYDRWRVRFGGGWQRSAFSNQGNEFYTRGYTAQIGIEHPRFQINGSLNSSIGNSLQSYGQMFNGIGMETAFLSPLHLVPSDLRGASLTLHAIPIRRLEISALFTRSVQHLEGIVANDFQVLDINATFHFRRLQFTAGYFNSTQIYSSYLAQYPETQRGRFYIRISRPFKLR